MIIYRDEQGIRNNRCVLLIRELAAQLRGHVVVGMTFLLLASNVVLRVLLLMS